MIFVFRSNLAGRHGKGAALFAKQNHGAVYGIGVGRSGNSYAIPTKGKNLEVLPLDTIKTFVDLFIEYAEANPDLEFQLTAIGCGLAGYKPAEIAPMFKTAPQNVHLPPEFEQIKENK